MRKSCGTFNCSTQINVSILVLGNFDVRYKNKNHLFFVEIELCIVPKSLWVISPTSEIVAHSNCSMKHLSFQHSSDFYSANIVIWKSENLLHFWVQEKFPQRTSGQIITWNYVLVETKGTQEKRQNFWKFLHWNEICHFFIENSVSLWLCWAQYCTYPGLSK